MDLPSTSLVFDRTAICRISKHNNRTPHKVKRPLDRVRVGVPGRSSGCRQRKLVLSSYNTTVRGSTPYTQRLVATSYLVEASS